MPKKPPRKPAKLTVSIHNLHTLRANSKRLTNIAKQIWIEEAVSDGRVQIILVDDGYIHELNKKFLHEDQPTDVIAFPIEQASRGFEGEIYISLDRVAENAAKYSLRSNEELCRVVAHALLHFLGYDDRTSAGKAEMTERENFYLKKLSSSSR